MGRLPADVPRHVHGHPRHPGGRDVAADDPGRARHLPRRDELDPDRLSDRRGDRDPPDRPVHARPDACAGCSWPPSALFTLASIGCAFSGSFAVLLVFRVVQGFSGGVLIPAVFSAVFLLFPPRLHAIATTVGGVVAVLAPTIGPVVGGWITETWSWPWLFLINVIPGLIAASVSRRCCCRARTPNLGELTETGRALAGAVGSGACQPRDRAEGGAAARLAVAALHRPVARPAPSVIGIFVRRTLRAAHPVVQLSTLKRRSFAVGCALELLPRRRPVRLGLSDAGVSRLRAPP